MSDRTTQRLLLLILLCSAVVRLLHYLEMRDADIFLVPFSDCQHYKSWAEDLLRGTWGRGDAYWMGPLYPHALAVIYLGSGLGVWLFARSAYHIGASGLTFGMMFFVFTIGALRWDKRAIALSLIVFFLYGGMIWGIFPTTPGISFEYHFFGAVLGVAMAVLLKNRDPAPPHKKYSWEEEQDDSDELMDLFPPQPEVERVDPAAPPQSGGPHRLH